MFHRNLPPPSMVLTVLFLMGAMMYSGVGILTGGEIEARITGETAKLSNAFLQLEVSLAGNRARTAIIHNRRTGKILTLEGVDFLAHLADGKQVATDQLDLASARVEDVGTTGKYQAPALPYRAVGGQCWSRIGAF